MPTRTHPLSGRELNIRETINGLIDTKRFDVLYAVNNCSLPTSQSEIAARAETSDKTAEKYLSEFQNHGIIKTYRENVEPTAGGKMLLDVLLEAFTEIPIAKDNCVELTRTKTPLTILSSLRREPQTAEDIQRRTSVSATEQTIKRRLKQFDKPDLDLADEEGHSYRLTDTGKEVLLAYHDVTIAIEQIIEKAEWFQRLPLENATVPVKELADATVVASDTASPSNVLGAALKLCDLRVSRFRCICSIYNPVLFFAYQTMLDFGVEAEAVLDWGAFVKSDQYTANVRAKYEHYQPLYLKDSHTLGVGIYDERKVAVGAYNEQGEGKHIAMIVSENPNIIEWAEDIYGSYRDMADCPEENPPDIDGGFDGRHW